MVAADELVDTRQAERDGPRRVRRTCAVTVSLTNIVVERQQDVPIEAVASAFALAKIRRPASAPTVIEDRLNERVDVCWTPTWTAMMARALAAS